MTVVTTDYVTMKKTAMGILPYTGMVPHSTLSLPYIDLVLFGTPMPLHLIELGLKAREYRKPKITTVSFYQSL